MVRSSKKIAIFPTTNIKAPQLSRLVVFGVIETFIKIYVKPKSPNLLVSKDKYIYEQIR